MSGLDFCDAEIKVRAIHESPLAVYLESKEGEPFWLDLESVIGFSGVVQITDRAWFNGSTRSGKMCQQYSMRVMSKTLAEKGSAPLVLPALGESPISDIWSKHYQRERELHGIT